MARILPRLALALLLAGAAGWAAFNRGQVSLEVLDSWLSSLGLWAPIGYVLLYAFATVAFVPGVVFALAGGALFGPFWGSIWNLAGATLGASSAFLVARYIVGDWVAHRAGGFLGKLINGVDAEGWRFVAFVRLVPLFPFNLSNYALGLTRIPLRHYVIATFICMAPGAIAFTWLGHAGRGALTGEADTVRYGLLALGLLAAIALAPRLIRRIRQKPRGIDVTEVNRRIVDRMPPAVLDVRDAADFGNEDGHIPGAINVPFPELERRLGELTGLRDGEIAVCCTTDKRSCKAIELLKANGFGKVLLVEGGMVAWRRRGLPVSRT